MEVHVDANPKEYAIVTDNGAVGVGNTPEGYTNNEAEYHAILSALEIYEE